MLASLKKRWLCLKSSKNEILSLDFKSENLDDIPSIVFMHERTLEGLCLNSNHIKLLPRELFLCMKLRSLFIADNDLTFIPPLIKTLPMLSHLDLSKNYITEIPECIMYCPNLSVLNASANPLERLPNDLSLMMCLTELYLNNTCLEQVPVVAGLINLKVLELRDNKLQYLPKSFSRLASLERLDLGNNKFASWPVALQNLDALEELSLNNNKITVISKEIGRLSSLSYLDLSENLIAFVHEDIGKCASLTDVYLNNNQIRELPQSLGDLKKLKKLRLDNNCLRELPSSIGSLQQLYELNASYNDLETIPLGISSLKNLRSIWLDDNLISVIPNELCKCFSLRLISIRKNKLEDLPESLGRLSQLTVINVVDNKITYLPNTIQMLRELKAIWIVENQNLPKVLFYPTTTKSGHKVTTCKLLPQQHQDNHDGAEPSSSKRRQSNKFVSFDGSAAQVQPHRTSAPYPKEMKNLAKSPRHTPLRSSLELDEQAADAEGFREYSVDEADPLVDRAFARNLAFEHGHNSSNFNLNAHGDLDVLGRRDCLRNSSSLEVLDKRQAPRRGFLRNDENDGRQAGNQDEPEGEIDVDQPLHNENSSGDDSVASSASYRDFLRNLSQYDIHLPKKRRKHRDSSNRSLRRQHNSEIRHRHDHHDLPEPLSWEERDVLRERNDPRQLPPTYFEDVSLFSTDRRMRTNSFHR